MEKKNRNAQNLKLLPNNLLQDLSSKIEKTESGN